MIDNITRLREVQLELLEEFIKVCKEHDLKYYAFFGTLLGSVRNEGYLPWDDDIDVAMPQEDYSLLCTNKDWFSDQYFLQTPIDAGLPNFTKLRKNGTTAFGRKLETCLRVGGHHGISIDIVPLSEIPGSKCYDTPSLRNPKKLDAVYLKEWFEPAAELKFEHLAIRAPKAYRKVLTEVYDSWAWPLGARECMPTYWFFDTEVGYEVYFKRYTGMLDDIEEKEIFLFGGGDSLRIWLERFDLYPQVVCAFDNNPAMWGKKSYNIDVRNPAEITSMLHDNSRVIIVSLWHQEIGKQLESMGINDYYVYLDFYYDEKVGNKIIRREDLKDGDKTIPKWGH